MVDNNTNNTEIIKKILKIFTIIGDYFQKKTSLFNYLLDQSKYRIELRGICSIIVCVSLIISIYLALIYIIYLNFGNVLYASYYNISNNFRNNPSAFYYPEFYQITDLWYITDSFSINWSLFIYAFLIIKIIAFIYIIAYNMLDSGYIHKSFDYIIPLFFIILVMILYYMFHNFSYINTLSLKVHKLLNGIYLNINADFLNAKICNYLKPKYDTDLDFTYGQCNNFVENFSYNSFCDYLKVLVDELKINADTSTKPFNDFKINDIKKIVDKNGINIYDKIVDTFFTYALIRYFVDNNMIEEGKEFFSLYNITNTNYLDKLFKNRINPFSYFKLNKLNILNYTFTLDNKMQTALDDREKLFYSILKDYYKIENSLSNIIIDIYNICKYKMISKNFIFTLTTLLILLIIIVYIFKNF